MYSVYMHKFPNGKVYIGATGMKPEKRWGRNGILYKSKIMQEAIKEFGWENVEHIILFENLERKEAESKEVEMILKYRSCEREHGYNSIPKSNTPVHSDKTRLKMSMTRKGRKPSEEHRKALSRAATGRKISAEAIQKIRESHLGSHLSEEHKSKISKSCKGKGAKAVVMISFEGKKIREFKSASEALLEVNGKSCSNISSCCLGKKRSAYGYYWQYK